MKWTAPGAGLPVDSGRISFHAIHGRPVVSLAPISFEPSRPDRLRERVREVLEEVPGGIEEKIVSLAERFDMVDRVFSFGMEASLARPF